MNLKRKNSDQLKDIYSFQKSQIIFKQIISKNNAQLAQNLVASLEFRKYLF